MKPTDTSQMGSLYSERLTSPRTTAFFTALTFLCTVLAVWRWRIGGIQPLVWFLLVLALLFLFYALNFRVLEITLTNDFIRLKFGIFTWQTPLMNIEQAYPDRLNLIQYYGGAGLHFMVVRGRYRAFYNFFEYPRVALALRRPAGPLREISFSTRRQDEIIKQVTRITIGPRDKKARRRN